MKGAGQTLGDTSRLVSNARVVFPGHVVASAPHSKTQRFKDVDGKTGCVEDVVYALSDACDDRSLHAPLLTEEWCMPKEASAVVLLAQFWGSEFYHWMVECLPRASLLPLDLLQDPSVLFLVPAPIPAFASHSLSLLGVLPHRLVPLDRSTVYHAPLLYLPSAGVCGVGLPSPAMRRTSFLLRQGLLLLPPPPPSF
ncbi:hypothetical protein T484DRAFT_1903758, partial [Baffinella frigidus]